MFGMKKKNLLRRVAFVLLSLLGLGVSVASPAFATTTATDMTSTITEWLPIILQFAIIGMIFGMLKKFGKW